MAIQWGGWSYAGNNGMRVGIDGGWVTGIDHNTVSAVYQFWVYTENQYQYRQNGQSINYSGCFGGSTAVNNQQGGGAVLRATPTYTYNYSDYGVDHSSYLIANVSGTYNGSAPGVQFNFGIPQRPIAPPGGMYWVDAHRNSDTQATITWSAATSAGAPVSSVTVQMRTYTGSTWGPFVDVMYLGPDATSYVHLGLSANHVYQWQIRTNNGAGSSAFMSTPGVWMTPAAPTTVISSLTGNGTTITTTWTDNSYNSGQQFTINRLANSVWTQVASGINGTTWTDPSPGAGANQYAIATTTTQAAGLQSAWAYGNTVSTIVPPLAPTGLWPNGIAVDLLNLGTTLTWKHNPGGDNAAQSHFRISTSIDNGVTWVALTPDPSVASTDPSYVVAPGRLANGRVYLWRVDTQGGTSVGFGPVSANATMTGSAVPVATITVPANLTVNLPMREAWTYNQDQGSAQTGWEATLYDLEWNLLETLTGTDTTSSVAFVYPVLDQTSYIVGVKVRSAAGLWSGLFNRTTLVSLPPPTPAYLTPTYDPTTGTMLLHIVTEASVPGRNVALDTVTVERRVNGGPWLTLVTGLHLPNDILDYVPVTNGLNEYRVRSISLAPSYLVNPVVVAPGLDGAPGAGLWTFLSYGDGFTKVLRMRGAPTVNLHADPTSVAQPLLGRRKPVMLTGIYSLVKLEVTGALHYDTGQPCPPGGLFDSPPVDWTDAGRYAEVVCFRDYTGRRLFGMLSLMAAADVSWPGQSAVSFTLLEIDFTEQPGVLVGA